MFSPTAKGQQKNSSILLTIIGWTIILNLIANKQTISEKPTFLHGTCSDEFCALDKRKYLGHVVQCDLSDNDDIYPQVRFMCMYGMAKTI